ncbi:MAG: OmpW family outer membrane protein [Ketobacter sp.]
MRRPLQWSVAIAASIGLMGLSAQSQATGMHTVKAGYGYTDFANDSGQLQGDGVPAGITAGAKNVDTFLLTYDYNFNKNWTFGLAVGIPPTVKLKAQASGQDLGEVGESKSLAPTFLAIYRYPLQGGWNVYAGLGVNYTKFVDVEVYEGYTFSLLSGVVGPVLAQQLIASGQASAAGEIDDSIGAAFKLGVSHSFAANWLIDLSYSYYDVTADISNTVNVNGFPPSSQKISIDVDPSLYSLSLGYTF